MAKESSVEVGKIQVGRKAPSFALKKEDDSTVKLADLKGHWAVLYFYPKDNTPGCTTEACEFTAGIKDLEKLDVVVLGCSPDSTESHRKFIAKYKLKVSLLSDPDKVMLKAYGAWGEKNMYGRTVVGVIRSTVIVNPEGQVARHWPRVRAAGHAGEVRQALVELKAAAA